MKMQIPFFSLGNKAKLTSTLVLACLLSACANMPSSWGAPTGVTTLAQQPAEHALLDGIRSYETGDFDAASQQLRTALQRGLASPIDQGAAHKYLAFIDCAFGRLPDCEAQFRQALAVDHQFHLTATEVGHPVWGPVYRRIIQSDTGN